MLELRSPAAGDSRAALVTHGADSVLRQRVRSDPPPGVAFRSQSSDELLSLCNLALVPPRLIVLSPLLLHGGTTRSSGIPVLGTPSPAQTSFASPPKQKCAVVSDCV
ncbi:unnamed protein product [Prorocentrum cordatum]|uniref:Uncharacterized protein n=1 Tax=Prorocentrum cordatum TaxID=2364126 RepID=A0ABN9QHC8_9DINO|nr:unnamed protein product [Polarella glacialis]